MVDAARSCARGMTTVVIHGRSASAVTIKVGQLATVSTTAYRRDSRVEVFADDPDWDVFERDLMACRLPAR